MKTLWQAGTLLGAALAFSGCAAAAPVTITFWSALGGSKLAATEWLVAQFQAAYPDIKVNNVIIGNTDQLDQKFIAAVAAGAPPDVVSNHFYYAQKYANKGILVDLDDLMAQSGLQTQDFLPPIVAEGAYQGRQYALPIYADTRILYYNKDLFSAAGLDPGKAPATWDDFAQDAAHLVKLDGSQFTQAAWDVGAHDTQPFLPFLWEWGGRFFDAAGKAAFNSRAGIDGWQFWVDLYRNHDYVPFAGGLSMWAGKAAMTFNNPASIQTMAQKLPGVAYGVARMPAGPAGRASFADSFQMWIPNNSPHSKEAWTFIAFAMRPDVQKRYNALSHRIPPLLAALRDNPDLADEHVQPFVDALQFDARPIPSSPEYTRIWDVLGKQLNAAMDGTTTTANALNTAAAQIDAITAGLGD